MLRLKRLVWGLLPLPKSAALRDRALIDRASAWLDAGGSVQGAAEILESHSLKRHALRALVRERDPQVLKQAIKAALEPPQ